VTDSEQLTVNKKPSEEVEKKGRGNLRANDEGLFEFDPLNVNVDAQVILHRSLNQKKQQKITISTISAICNTTSMMRIGPGKVLIWSMPPSSL